MSQTDESHTDEQLKKTLAKMLPEEISYLKVIAYESGKAVCLLQWGAKWNDERDFMVQNTELLHLCHLVEKSLCEYSGEHGGEYSQRDNYAKELMKLNGTYNGNGWSWGDVCNADLFRAANSTWQQRVIALAKVKGIEIKDKE